MLVVLEARILFEVCGTSILGLVPVWQVLRRYHSETVLYEFHSMWTVLLSCGSTLCNKPLPQYGNWQSQQILG